MDNTERFLIFGIIIVAIVGLIVIIILLSTPAVTERIVDLYERFTDPFASKIGKSCVSSEDCGNTSELICDLGVCRVLPGIKCGTDTDCSVIAPFCRQSVCNGPTGPLGSYMNPPNESGACLQIDNKDVLEVQTLKNGLDQVNTICIPKVFGSPPSSIKYSCNLSPTSYDSNPTNITCIDGTCTQESGVKYCKVQPNGTRCDIGQDLRGNFNPYYNVCQSTNCVFLENADTGSSFVGICQKVGVSNGLVGSACSLNSDCSFGLECIGNVCTSKVGYLSSCTPGSCEPKLSNNSFSYTLNPISNKFIQWANIIDLSPITISCSSSGVCEVSSDLIPSIPYQTSQSSFSVANGTRMNCVAAVPNGYEQYQIFPFNLKSEGGGIKILLELEEEPNIFVAWIYPFGVPSSAKDSYRYQFKYNDFASGTPFQNFLGDVSKTSPAQITYRGGDRQWAYSIASVTQDKDISKSTGSFQHLDQYQIVALENYLLGDLGINYNLLFMKFIKYAGTDKGASEVRILEVCYTPCGGENETELKSKTDSSLDGAFTKVQTKYVYTRLSVNTLNNGLGASGSGQFGSINDKSIFPNLFNSKSLGGTTSVNSKTSKGVKQFVTSLGTKYDPGQMFVKDYLLFFTTEQTDKKTGLIKFSHDALDDLTNNKGYYIIMNNGSDQVPYSIAENFPICVFNENLFILSRVVTDTDFAEYILQEYEFDSSLTVGIKYVRTVPHTGFFSQIKPEKISDKPSTFVYSLKFDTSYLAGFATPGKPSESTNFVFQGVFGSFMKMFNANITFAETFGVLVADIQATEIVQKSQGSNALISQSNSSISKYQSMVSLTSNFSNFKIYKIDDGINLDNFDSQVDVGEVQIYTDYPFTANESSKALLQMGSYIGGYFMFPTVSTNVRFST